jgi:hypothetical protein
VDREPLTSGGDRVGDDFPDKKLPGTQADRENRL